MGDGVATMVSGSFGGTGVTTYAENIGVMAATRIYSSLLFVLAACMAIFLGFSPKFGEIIRMIPGPVLGGMSIVVFGLITVAGARRSEEHTSELQSRGHLVCRLLLE